MRRTTAWSASTKAMALPPQSRTLACGGGSFTTSESGAVKVWDVQTSQEVFTLKGHTRPVYSVCFWAAELWGQGSHSVILDLWESYLEEAP